MVIQIFGAPAAVVSPMIVHLRSIDMVLRYCAVWIAVAILLEIAYFVTQRSSPRATRIEGGDVRFDGVSPIFAQQLKTTRIRSAEEPNRQASESTTQPAASNAVMVPIRDAEAGRFPPICVHCGGDASALASVTLTWASPEIAERHFVLVAAVMERFLRKTAHLRLPMCDRDRGRLSRWQSVRILVAIVMLATLIATVVVVAWDLIHFIAAFGSAGVVAVIWSATESLARDSTIRAGYIDNERVLLENVSARFAEATVESISSDTRIRS
jgi:hypothetical protein